MEYTDEKFERFMKGEITENQLLGKREEGKFYVGDRVRGIGLHDGKPINGKVGTIRLLQYSSALVEFDENIGGHTGNGRVAKPLPEGHGWFVAKSKLEFIE
jgi:hypothetical protein